MTNTITPWTALANEIIQAATKEAKRIRDDYGAENQMLIDAIRLAEFYSNPSNHESKPLMMTGMDEQTWCSTIEWDAGQKARDFLKKWTTNT